ncbi:hypothetical protein HRE53_10060 [Acaryochloris sp. 'Moss Beach']|uniref:hypothetical protein n=1 Tax=Acaryochloris sp. 'Moss Beach' TaxID=2740837 RepID=UPI001F30F940|nr:hypothetical protein [Acaryochloris sp. 'Moss Beach']UJB71303.1 hypothetical protein HRE53_10060 [Acaryochloris sp. 'Moss Beach']
MSVDFSLFRVANSFLQISSDQRISELNEKVVLPFGSFTNIVERICDISGFSQNFAEEATSLRIWEELDTEDRYKLPLAWINYRYQLDNIYGRVLHFTIWDDPVSCIMVNRRAYVEDFFPIIDVLKNLEPFLVLNPSSSKLISPHEFKYSMEEWFQKNSVGDELNFKY